MLPDAPVRRRRLALFFSNVLRDEAPGVHCVEPELQRQGIGAALISFRVHGCDADSQAAYLESSNPKNPALYARLGFQPTGLLALPAGAPEVTTMWRPPARVHLEK
jgi:predicted N-acetyltransferase YhbS